MAAKELSVKLYAEQVTETHRTLENDRTVTEVELPGIVNVYLDFDGGRILFDQIKAGRVLDAQQLAKDNAPQQTEQPSQSQTTEPPADSGPQSQTVSEPQG